jgi:adenylylsulfate kinase
VSGPIAWITGLPGSGKSTFARLLEIRLRQAARPAVILDSDEVRGTLVPPPDYSPAGRDAFYDTLARLAALLAKQGFPVIVAATANRRAFRERARHAVERFIEVYVATSAGECARRDPKGLYAAARSAQENTLPGAGEPYEIPESPDAIARDGEDEEALDRVVTLLS